MEAFQNRRKTHSALPCLGITKIILFLMIRRAASISFHFPQFLDQHNYQNYFNFSGDVYQEKGVLQLTRNGTDSVGRITYTELLQLWDTQTRKIADFKTNFSFIIISLDSNHRGDGITFFLAHPDFPLPTPPDGLGIGLVGRREMNDPNFLQQHPFVSVEFDTFPNTNNGYDPSYDHVGIDIKNMWSPYTTQWYNVKDGRKYDAEITYNSTSHILNVSFTGYQNNTKVLQHYSHEIDLRDFLPDQVQFGISSATGLIFEIHTLCSWSFDSVTLTESGSQNKKRKKKLIMGLSIGSGVVLISGLLCLSWLVIWKMKRRHMMVKKDDAFDLSLDDDFERSIGPRKFSYEELVRATSNFSEEHKLGEGGFGVYRGFIRDFNTHVAVKKVSQGSRQGVKEYAAEVKIINQLRHKNLVQLIGWCHNQKNDLLLLIYEFMSNGSLDYHLFRSGSLLTWTSRYAIAQGIALAILYLHEEWEQCVVHRDIKSSNIMLDSNFNAKLGDFGLARLVEHGDKGSQTTVIAGTKGYMAPECATISKATKESDVYSFGIVALEIACGRKPIDLNASDELVVMVEWVWELYGTGKVLEAADPRLFGEFNEEELERLMILGLWCAHPNYMMRPTIRQAVNVLNFEASLPSLPPKMPKSTYVVDPSFSGIRSSGFYSINACSSSSSSSSSSGVTQTKGSNTSSYTRSSLSATSDSTVLLTTKTV